ncbi:MAG: RHS repeat-associated core domain-containing protein [Velocimicrobium sp.]
MSRISNQERTGYRIGQKGDSGWDNILSNVNLFNGTAVFPITLFQCDSVDNLSMSLQLQYQSRIGEAVMEENKAAPTSLAGFGWSLPLACICAMNRTVKENYQGDFYFLSEGGQYPLYRRGVEGGSISFESIEHPLWTFRYYEANEEYSYWEVTKEDGSVWRYGGSDGSIESHLAWDNWTGSTVENGGESYPVGWYLEEICSYNENKVTFVYDNVKESLGNQQYTRAIHLREIEMPTGEHAKLVYDEKEEFEVIPSYESVEDENAYQCAYDTQYLDKVELYNADEQLLYIQQLNYTFINIPQKEGCNKRFLSAVTQVDASGVNMPPISFSYILDPSQPNAGALETLRLPTGTSIKYHYTTKEIEASLNNETVYPPTSDWAVQTVQMSDYVLFKYSCDNRVSFTISYWDLSWRMYQDTSFEEESVSNVQVFPAQGFFAVLYFSENMGRYCLRIYKRGMCQSQTWEIESITLESDRQVPAIACGSDYVAVQSSVENALHIYQYVYVENAWKENVLSVESQDFQALGGGNGFILGAYYNASAANIRLQTFYADADHNWQYGSYRDVQQQVNWLLTNQQSVWAVGGCEACATFVTLLDQNTAQSLSLLMRWRENYQITDVQIETMKQDGTTTNPILYSVIAENVIGHAQMVYRYSPGAWRKYQLLESRKDGEYRYAYGSDLAIAVEKLDTTQKFYAIRFDPYEMTWTTDKTPQCEDVVGCDTLCVPHIINDVALMGRQLFIRDEKCNWNRIYSLPEYAQMDTIQIDPEGKYVLYQINERSTVVMLRLQNNEIVEEMQLDGEIIQWNSGDICVSQQAFHTAIKDENAIRLYALDDKRYTTKRSVTILDKITMDGGVCEQSYCFDYDLDTLRFGGTSPMFMHVKALPIGVNAPYGWNRYTYFNGVAPTDPRAEYPEDNEFSNARAFYSQFVGQLCSIETYDNAGKLQSQEYNWLKALDQFGFVICQTRTASRKWLTDYSIASQVEGNEQKMVESIVDREYEPKYYQLRRMIQRGRNEEGKETGYEQLYQYSWEKYSELEVAHVLSQQVFSQKSEILTKKIIEASAVCYRLWDNQKWRECKKYDWSGEGVPQLPEEKNLNNWYLTEMVTRRNSKGERIETMDERGYYSSVLYDANDQFIVAEFEKARLDDVHYCGFESYEIITQWKCLSSEATIDSMLYAKECFSGTRCLEVPANTAVSVQLDKSNYKDEMIVSCAIKQLNTNGTTGKVRIISNNEEKSLVAEFDLSVTGENWCRFYKRIDVRNQSVDNGMIVVLKGANEGSLLIDAVFITPLHCNAKAKVYTGAFLLQTAEHNNKTIGTRTYYDHLKRPVVTADDEGNLLTCARFFSRAFYPEIEKEYSMDATASFTFNEKGDWSSIANGRDINSVWDVDSNWEHREQLLLNSSSKEARVALRDKTSANFVFFVALQEEQKEFKIVTGDLVIQCKDQQGVLVKAGQDALKFTLPKNDKMDYLLVRIANRIAFYCSGVPVMVAKVDSQLVGSLIFSSTSVCGISHIGYANAPSYSISYTDSTGRPIQDQQIVENGVIVSQTVYSDYMQASISTKKAYFDNELWNYRDGFVSNLDWNSGKMDGEISTMYPEYNGFPYVRTKTTKSPRPQPAEMGQFGNELSIHEEEQDNYTTTVKEYIADNDLIPGDFMIPNNLMNMVCTKEPNKKSSYSISDDFGNEIYKIQRSEDGRTQLVTQYRYNEKGLAVEVFYPEYFNKAIESKQYKETIEYDDYGNISKKVGIDTGMIRMIYDQSGRLHYQQDAVNQEKDRYIYHLYDEWDREIECGFGIGEWDETALREKAYQGGGRPDEWVWYKQYQFDGDSDCNFLWGQLWKCRTVNNVDDESATVEEEFEYDTYGNVVQHIQRVNNIEHVRTAGYDLNGILLWERVDDKDEVSYEYDLLGRMTKVLYNGQEICRYEYDADGKLVKEVFASASQKPLERRYTYDVNGCMTKLQDSYFMQSLQYDVRSGRIQQYRLDWADELRGINPLQHLTVNCAYDGLGRLLSEEYVESKVNSFGVKQQGQYDLNSNLLLVDDKEFCYKEATNQLLSMDGVAYGYDAFGAVIEKKSAEEESLTIEYHPLLQSVSNVKVGSNEKIFLQGNDGVAAYLVNGNQTYCMQNDNGALLKEFYADGSECLCIHGANGMFAQVKDGKIFYLLKDYQSSVRAIYDGESIAAIYHYTPFGSIMKESYESESIKTLIPVRFTSQILEIGGLYRFRNRWYDPSCGRFLSIDPKLQYSSPYLYGSCDWVNYVDPDGAWSWGAMFASIATILVGVTLVVAGVALSVASAGIASPVGAFLAVTGSAFIAGFGFSAAVYGVTSLVSNEYDIKDCLIQAALGGTFAAIGVGAGALLPVLSPTMTIVADVGMGFVIGGADGVVTNGCLNVVHGQSFSDNMGTSFLIGGTLGAVFGGISGIGRAGKNAMALRGARNGTKELVVGDDGLVRHASFYRSSRGAIRDGSHLTLHNGAVNGTIENIGGHQFNRWTAGRGMRSTRIKVSRQTYRSVGQYQGPIGGNAGTYRHLTNDCVSHVVRRLGGAGLQVPLWARTPYSLRIWATLLGSFQ